MPENKLTPPEKARSAYYANTRYGASDKLRRKAKTSARAIKLRQRRAECLNYRLAGHSYRAIGAQMHIHPSVVHRHVLTAMQEIVPREKAEALLNLELQRLDQLQSAFFVDAANGDAHAAEIVLKVMQHRARLAFPQQQRSGGVNVNIGGPPSTGPDAETLGINLVFVKGLPDPDRDPPRLINGEVGPSFIPSPLNGNGIKK